LQIAAPAIRKALPTPPIKLISLDASNGSTRFGQLELGCCLGSFSMHAVIRRFVLRADQSLSAGKMQGSPRRVQELHRSDPGVGSN